MDFLPALTGLLAGVLGGVLGGMFRNLHLELEWWQTRRSLQRFFASQRKARIAELAPREEPAPVDRTADLMKRYREMTGVS